MGNETNKEKKEKAAIVDEPMTPVPLDQRQHWITPAVIFGGLEFCVLAQFLLSVRHPQ